jgi:hypothetical protein
MGRPYQLYWTPDVHGQPDAVGPREVEYVCVCLCVCVCVCEESEEGIAHTESRKYKSDALLPIWRLT